MSIINYLPLNKKKNMLSCVYFAVVEYQMHKGWIVDYCLWLVGCFLLGFKNTIHHITLTVEVSGRKGGGFARVTGSHV